MSIRIEITGDTPQAIAESIISMAFLIAPKMREQAAPVEAETVEPERKPRRSRKAETTIEHDAREGSANVHGDTDGAAVGQGATGSAGSTGDSHADAASTEAGSAGEDAKSETPAEVDAVADAKPSMTIDELRKFTINEYLNVVTDKLDERKNRYKALLDEFKVEAINALAENQIDAFKAAVDAKIAEAVKA